MPSSDSRLAQDFFEERFAQEKARAQSALFAGVQADTQVWLAALPFVTEKLAEAAGLPAGEGGVSATLGRMVSAGLVEASAFGPARDGGELVYRMTDAARALVLEPYLAGGGARALRERISQIGRQIAGGTASSLEPGSPMRRWAALAAQSTDSAALTAAFEEEVAACEQRRNPVGLKQWIDSARPFAALLARDYDSSLDVALHRAARRLELLDRHRQDDVHLQPWFVERHEQIEAIRLLVTGPDDLWALHLYGEGGVGKTMLLRYLTSRLAPAPGDFQAATARIDFDYLNADYPRLDPGLILWASAQELRLFDPDGRSTDLFDKANRLLNEVQQRRRDPAMATQRAADDPRFANALVPYIDAMRSLGQRVVLIIDTCEELAKIRPDGSIPENVDETFRILEALHDGPRSLGNSSSQTGTGLPSLRVIFAGRRPLASAGHGWRCTASRLPPRPYLRLHELRGFTEGEAALFLRQHASVPEPLVEPIIRRCREAESGQRAIEWLDAGARPPSVPRINPYDLRQFADWAAGDPPPDPATVAGASAAQYVELRILKRLEKLPDLERALPFIALLKHVDRELLQVILGAASDSDLVFDRLCEQEWAAHRQVSGPDGKPRDVAVVDEALRRRLWKYYHDRGRFPAEVIRRVARYLADVTLRRDLSELDWPLFDAALRALEHDAAGAAEWWEHAESRIIDLRGFGWLSQLTGFLLGEGNAAAAPETLATPDSPAESVLRPRIVASYAAALLHTGAEAARFEAWAEVLDKADRHPLAAGRTLLHARARCGIVAARIDANAAPTEQQVCDVWRIARDLDAAALDENLASALVAATEAILEHNERGAGARPPLQPLPLSLDGACGPLQLAERVQTAMAQRHAARGLVAYAWCLAGRALLQMGLVDQAVATFDRAAALLPVPGGTWADWLPPEHLDSRIRVEAIRLLYPSVSSIEEASRWCHRAPDGSESLENADHDRFMSISSHLLLTAGAPVDLSVIYGWARWSWSPETGPRPGEGAHPRGPSRRASCCAHMAIPPFLVNAAAHLAACGYVDHAQESLQRLMSGPEIIPAELIHAGRALARIALRMRLRDEGERASAILEDSPFAQDRGLLWALNGLEGGKNLQPIAQPPALAGGEPERGAWLHAIWRGCYALDEDRAADAVAWLGKTLPDDPDLTSAPFQSAAGMARFLDFHEGFAVQLRFDSTPHAIPPPHPIDLAWRPRDHEPEEALVLLSRSAALGAGPPLEPMAHYKTGALEAHLGLRRAAELLFEEGDLLALRLPDQSRALLRQALELYQACEDPVATFITFVRLAEIDPSSAVPERSYAQLRAAVEGIGLPEWEELVAVADNPDAASLDRLAPRGWRPWLVRLVGTLLVARRRQGRPEELARYIEWVTLRYGAPADGSVLLPAELEGIARAGAAMPGPQPQRPVRAPASGRRWRARAWDVAAATGGAALLVGFLFLGPKAYQFSVKILPPGWQTTPLVIGGFVLLLALASSWRLIVTAARSLYTSTWRLKVRIVFHERGFGYRSESVQAAARFGLQIWRPRLFPAMLPIRLGVGYRADDWVEADAATPGAIAYQVAAGLLPQEVVAVLRDTVRRLDARSVDVEISPLDADLQGPCWEAMLHHAVGDPAEPSKMHLRCRRAARRDAALRGLDIAVLASTTAGQDIARAAWSELRRPVFVGDARQGRWLGGERPNPFEISSNGNGSVTTLHVVGTVERTPGGLRLRRGHESSRSEAPAEALEAAIVRAFPNLGLCILQGEPLRVAAPRLDDDRLTASLARSFAAEMAEQSHAAVLLLPPLRASLTIATLGRVVAVLKRRPRRGTRALQRCVKDIQEMIANEPDDPGGGWEHAMDVCLFCHSDWDGRFA
jgi:hypothetical protein